MTFVFAFVYGVENADNFVGIISLHFLFSRPMVCIGTEVERFRDNNDSVLKWIRKLYGYMKTVVLVAVGLGDPSDHPQGQGTPSYATSM